MKVTLVLVACLVSYSYGASAGECILDLFPSFRLKVNESFPIQQGCIQLTCKEGNLFEMTHICPSFCKGCPISVVEHKKHTYGKKILDGRICED